MRNLILLATTGYRLGGQVYIFYVVRFPDDFAYQ